MAKYGYKKTKNGFSFYGDLQECINAGSKTYTKTPLILCAFTTKQKADATRILRR